MHIKKLNQAAMNVLRVLQALYALARETVPGLSSTSGLPQLYVDGFDSEQIWGQLEAGSKPALRKARKQIKSLHSCEAMMDEETEATLDGKFSMAIFSACALPVVGG